MKLPSHIEKAFVRCFAAHNNDRTPLRSQSGNIFFALFGAVALVGVVGATTMGIMKGPIKTMANINRQTMAETNMMAGMQVGMVAATTQQSNDGDCDSDTFVEPLPYRDGTTTPHPTGGGYIPNQVGVTKQDPWRTEYGYCVWDHGSQIDDAGCGGATQKRLQGANSTAFPALAIISAGPNRTFETICRTAAEADSSANGGNDSGTLDTDEKLVYKPSGSDDILISYSYAEAAGSTGGLWTLKSGDPGTAEINKSIEFSGGLKMGTSEGTGGSVLDAVCAGPTDVGVMRFDPFASGGSGGIEVCDYTGTVYGWQPISGGGGAADSLVQDDGSETCTATDADTDGTPDDTGKVRYNTVSAKYEVCDGSIPGWREIIVGSTAATLVLSPDSVTIDVDGTSQTTTPRYSHTASPYVEVTVKNIGSAAMGAAFASGDFVWSSNSNFEIVTNNCTGVTLTESGGAQDSCTLELRAYAYTDGGYSATLTVNQNNAPVLALDGTSTNTCTGVGQAMGGGIKVACYDTYDLIAMPAGCADQAAVDTATECTGTDWLKKQWASATGTVLSANSYDDGTYNASKIGAYTGAVEHPAFTYCDNLVTDATYDDWYLPARNELGVLQSMQDTIGGFINNSVYWSSSETNSIGARIVFFANGTSGENSKTGYFYFRCVRRHTGGASAPAAEPVTKPGYFVLTKNSYQGDFTQYNSQSTGRAAADEVCLNELLNNQWMGRENTVLNSETVKAFMVTYAADRVSILPNTRYYFATAGTPTVGGAFFDTDADGLGPYNQINWAGTNYFGTPATYWTGMQSNAGQPDVWTLVGANVSERNCASFSNSSTTGYTGSSVSTGEARWTGNSSNCSNEHRLVCMVHPSSEAATDPVEDPGSAGTGFFVLSKNTYDGNLGGTAGADALCLSDLTNSNWKGRDNVALNSSTVQAMFVTTRVLMGNTRYYFAKAGDAYAGGAYFDTYEDGLGPYDSNAWSGRTYFDGAATYWARGLFDDTVLNWSNVVNTSKSTCFGYVNNESAKTGVFGSSISTEQARWRSGTGYCDSLRHLICVVHPSGDEVTPPVPDPIDNGPGYFVLTKNQYNGDLGGFAGANAICLDEMTNNNWRGRDNVTLNSSTVRAFLVSYDSAQNPLPNQRYYFAVAGNATAGGAWFDTNSTGQGPGNAYNWTGSNYFAGAREYWTGLRPDSGDANLFSLSRVGSFVCFMSANGSWGTSSNTVTGTVGVANSTGSYRWKAPAATCDQLKHLVCIVDPAPEDDPTPAPADPLDAGPGYFVMTSESYTGDLVTEAANRGLSGTGLDAANALCLKDLTDHDWYGRSTATLNSSTVRAFLCQNSGVLCNTLLPMQRYYFARSNNTAINSSGSGWFDTGSTGLGPNDSAIWSDSNHFGGVVNYWSGREHNTGGTTTHWGATQSGDSADCVNWDNSTVSFGGLGSTGSTVQGRWISANYQDCSIPHPLICIVDPSSDDATDPPPAAPDYVCNSAGFCGTYSVNAGTAVRIKLWGAGGGGGKTNLTFGGAGGGGGYVEFATTPSVDTTYHIYVGGGGQLGGELSYAQAAGGSSYTGYTGGTGGYFTSYAGGGGGGGGATLLFDGDPSVSGVLVAVAAGGGGGGGGAAAGKPAGAAGSVGGMGSYSLTQTAGGAGGNTPDAGLGGSGGGGAGWTGNATEGGGDGGIIVPNGATPAPGGSGGVNYTVSGAVASGSGQYPPNIDDVYYESPRGQGGGATQNGYGGLALIYFGENAE